MAHGLKLIAPVQFSVEPQERRRLKAAARRQGVSMSEFIRTTLRERLAGRQLPEPDTEPDHNAQP